MNFSSHNNESTGVFGEGFVDAAQSVASNSSMSGSGPAAPPPGRRKVVATRSKHANFSACEDKMLCKAWLEISCDAATNTAQRKESFWGRVLDRYNSKCDNYPKRTLKSISNRWDHIKAEVNKFAGYMAEKIRTNPSGMSDADKSVVAATDFASGEKHNFTLIHCWQVLKDEPKWAELKTKMDNPHQQASKEGTPNDSNTRDLDPNNPSPPSSSGKHPMGRDAANAAKKKAAAASSENVSKMHDLSLQKIELFKDTEVERKDQLDQIVTLEKEKAEETREYRNKMYELEKERLTMDKQRLQMDWMLKREREEEQRIMAVNLDQCNPMERIYYHALQEEIVHKMLSRRQGPNL